MIRTPKRTRTRDPIPDGTPLRVALYERRSTDDEHQPYTIEAQDLKLRAYVDSQPGWAIVATYRDDASGATTDRPELRKALAAARAGWYDLLIGLPARPVHPPHPRPRRAHR